MSIETTNRRRTLLALGETRSWYLRKRCEIIKIIFLSDRNGVFEMKEEMQNAHK